MDAERYGQVRDLFLAVDEIPREQQRQFLIAQCGGDQELVDEVMSLLREHDADSALVEGASARKPVFPQESIETSAAEDRAGGADRPSIDADGSLSQPASATAPYLPGNGQRSQADFSPADSTADFLTPGERRRKRKTGRELVAATAGSAAQVTRHGAQRTHASPRYKDDVRRPASPRSTGVWQSSARRHRRFNLGWLWMAALLPTAIVGWWTYANVAANLREATANELAGVADSVRVNVARFLEDQSRLAESWSRQPDLRDSILALLATHADDESNEALLDSPHAMRIREQLFAVSQSEEIKYVVWDRTGTIIASWLKDGADVGGVVAPEGAADLARAMRGDTVLFGPEILEADDSGFDPETELPVMAEILPIHDSQGRVVAAMLIRGFGMFHDFDEIFRQVSEAGGLDVYAVNRRGVMVTNSPNAMKWRSTDDPTVGSVACRLRVTDPGPSPVGDASDSNRRHSQRLTYAVADASSNRSGASLDAYRNYAGVPVVGSWRWVDRWDLGIIVERSSSTALASAGLVRFGFLSLGLMLTATALAAAGKIAKRTALAQAAVHPLSRYELLDQLGSGGMGVVYRARHRQLDRDTALKVLRGDRDNLEDRLRFDREAKLAASLSSPHTVTIYDYGRSDEGEAYCVMEFLKGITLYDVVARSGFQPYGRTLFILRQICDSLGEAHQLGLVHRDIKPQNVMLSLDASVGDWAVVFDFGLAKPLQPDSGAYQTVETVWAGTPMYMAPERYRDPNVIDPRSDLYSVGCIAYFLLSGRPPFIECDPESLFALVLTEKPISIGVHRDEEVPQEIVDLVERCMAKSVEDRFASVDELAIELDSLISANPWSVDDARSWWRIHGEDFPDAKR